MKGVSKELKLIFQEILNDNTLTKVEKVKKINENRSFLSQETLGKLFDRSGDWFRNQLKK